MTDRKRILFEEEDEGVQWVVTYHLGYPEYDDLDESEMTEISLTAPDFDTAVRYAQQYLRQMQLDEETSEKWEQAEILSVELR